MIYCGKRDNGPNFPGFSGYRSTIIPQIRENLASFSAFLTTIPILGQPPKIQFPASPFRMTPSFPGSRWNRFSFHEENIFPCSRPHCTAICLHFIAPPPFCRCPRWKRLTTFRGRVFRYSRPSAPGISEGLDMIVFPDWSKIWHRS